MASPIEEIRALLMQFERSPLRDLSLRTQDWMVFMAREGGAANPMLAPAQLAVAPELAPSMAISAPHLGVFEPGCSLGDVLASGALIGLIDVLGRKTEVFSDQAGEVVAICAPANGLVEFGDRLVEIAAAA